MRELKIGDYVIIKSRNNPNNRIKVGYIIDVSKAMVNVKLVDTKGKYPGTMKLKKGEVEYDEKARCLALLI